MYNPLEVCPSPAASSPQTGNKNLHVRTKHRKITTYTSCASLCRAGCPVIFLRQLLLQRATLINPYLYTVGHSAADLLLLLLVVVVVGSQKSIL